MTKGKIRVGVGGWDFDPWRGTFYPPGLAKAKQLDYAAGHLTAIEVNSTYYSSQNPATFAKWARAAPDGFQFSVKASRYTTNRKLLAEAQESVTRFLSQGIIELGDRLGPIVWQFMPTKKFDPEDFSRFLELLPKTQDGVRLRHALEVRHESFADPAFYELARKADAAIVFADSDKFPRIEQPTSTFTYARFQRAIEECPTGYDATALDALARQTQGWAARGDVFAFFISGAKVRNPAAAQALIAKLA